MEFLDPNDPDYAKKVGEALEEQKKNQDLHQMRHEAAYNELIEFVDSLGRRELALLFTLISSFPSAYSNSAEAGITVVQRWLGNIDTLLRIKHGVHDATNPNKLIDIILGD